MYQWDTISNKGLLEICELASAFPHRNPNLNEKMLRAIFKDNYHLQLFLNSHPTEEGGKDVASNLRFKKDKDINNAVVINTIIFLDFYNKLNDNPIVITSYPRNIRKYSFKMLENGDVKVINNYRKIDPNISTYERNLNDFFEKVNLNENRRKRMRYSSEGANFFTYFADLLSFITQIDYFRHPEMFFEKWLSPNVKNIENGLEKVVEKFKLPWEPKEGYDYLYFKDDRKGYKFMFPCDGSIEKVSHQMWELLSPQENGTKLLVREHFNNINIYKRWSDYNVNDVDDGITICAIYHAYLYTNDNYKEVKGQLEFIINQWFHSLDTLP